MLMMRDVRRGEKKGSAEIKKKFLMFLDFSWQPLLKNPATPSYFNSGVSEERGRLQKAERHVHEGALSQAAGLLTSSGLALDTDDTRQKLKEK